MTYEADELRRTWKKCSCPIYASGTLSRSFKRKNTEQTSWHEAKAVAADWETAGRWQSDAPPPPRSLPHPSVETKALAPESATIERAVTAFLAEHAESSAPNTQKRYGIIVKKQARSAEKGYVMIDQWGPIDVREFRQSWNVSPATGAKNMSVVKTFFEFALSNEWITRNPARLVKNPRARAGDGPRMKARARKTVGVSICGFHTAFARVSR